MYKTIFRPNSVWSLYSQASANSSRTTSTKTLPTHHRYGLFIGENCPLIVWEEIARLWKKIGFTQNHGMLPESQKYCCISSARLHTHLISCSKISSRTNRVRQPSIKLLHFHSTFFKYRGQERERTLKIICTLHISSSVYFRLTLVILSFQNQNEPSEY